MRKKQTPLRQMTAEQQSRLVKWLEIEATGAEAELLGLYRTFTTEQLQDLRAAFLLDRDELPPPYVDPDKRQAFIDGRLALIHRVLAERTTH